MSFFKPKSKQLGNGLIFVPLLLLSSSAMAQPGSSGGSDPYNNQYTNFSPSMAIIIVVLIAALFFMGFFSVYIRHCADRSGGSARPNFSIRSRRAGAARGLDPEVIETFPTFAYSVVKGLQIGKGVLECAVCLNEFQDDETLRLLPKCDHVFHPECIDAWLESHVTCPVCRANLVPQPGEPVQSPAEAQLAETETDLQTQTADIENQQNGDVSIRVCEEQENPEAPVMTRSSSVIQTRPPRSGSVRQLFGRFRSHSTGHSLVQPGQNMDRFTLRLPEDVRKQVISRALLNRTASCVVTVGESGSRTGHPPGEGSTRGRNYRRLERLETNRAAGRSDRWIFSVFSRASSMRSPKFTTENGEGSTSAKTPRGVVKMPSFKCLEPKGDEACLVSDDSARPPV